MPRTISEAPTEIQAITPLAEDEAWTFRNQLKRISLRDRPTQITLGAIVLIIALIAGIAAWPKSSTDTGKLTQAAGTGGNTTATNVTNDKGPTAKTAITSTGKGPGGTSKNVGDYVVNPQGNLAYANRIGATIKPQTYSFPGGNHNTWVGVTATTIKAVFSYDKANCGVNLINAISQAGANLPASGRFYRKSPTDTNTQNAETVESVNVIVDVFNKRGYQAFDQYPQIKAINDKLGGSPTTPFYGRKLVHEFIDGGSFQCPTTTTAAAVEIVQHRKPFVVFNNFDGAQYNMADALHAKAPNPVNRPMHFGTLWLSDADYNRWAPFAWTQFNSGTKAADLYAQWICARKVGQKAVNSPEQKDKIRKFALLYPNLTEAKHVADALKGFVTQYCGMNIYGSDEFAYAPDPSRAADEGNTIAVRLKLDGVTTLSYLMDPIFPLFQIIAFEGQSYYPEVMWSPTGYYDSNTVQRLYDQKFMDKRSSGITQFGVPGGWGFTAGDAFYAYHDIHQVSPKDGQPCDPNSDAGMDHDAQYCKAPSAIITWYYTTLATLGGIVFAGPDLNPTSLSRGLQAYPGVRFGGAGPTDKPHPAQLGSGPGHYYFIVDATEYQWRAGFISPPPEQKTGFIEYPDCERHYVGWKPERLASGWEKGGPNYNAFCGNAKYANFGSTPYKPGPHDIDKQGNQNTCGNTPSKTCEKDNYPDWQAW